MVPDAENKVINIIDTCVKQIAADSVQKVYLLGSEGSIDSGVYQKALEKCGITCLSPAKDDYALLRSCIEAVKQNKYNPNIEMIFIDLMRRYDIPYILGCTELPILYKKYMSNSDIKVYDPLLITLQNLKEEYDNE